MFKALLFSIALFGLASVAHAVSVDPKGFGQALLYPYYTVKSTTGGNAYSTLFTVTNTTEDTKIIRVRFRESRNGRQVASVNVFLAPRDSWTGAIVSGTGGPSVVTYDTSCTDPPSLTTSHTAVFSNAQYSGTNADGEDASVERAGEGYFEVFDLGVVVDGTVMSALDPNLNITPNCSAALGVTLNNATNVRPPTGGLIGSANIVNVGDGTLYAYDATALADFSAVPLWSPPTATTPTLADVNPKISRVLDASGTHDASWDVTKGAAPADPVSAVLMANQVVNWYVLDTVTNSGTDWIVTMPTKPFYTDPSASGGAAPRAPFESAFGTAGAADFFGNYPIADCSVGFNRTIPFDREGHASGTACTLPPPPTRAMLNWVANVVTFNGSNLFGSPIGQSYPTPFVNGWAKLVPFQYSSGQVHKLTSTDSPSQTYYGLPMIGFMANNYMNRTLLVGGQPVLSNYSATSSHKFMTQVN
jgi:hypothetical protein